jgi:hypothetical protein
LLHGMGFLFCDNINTTGMPNVLNAPAIARTRRYRVIIAERGQLVLRLTTVQVHLAVGIATLDVLKCQACGAFIAGVASVDSMRLRISSVDDAFGRFLVVLLGIALFGIILWSILIFPLIKWFS